MFRPSLVVVACLVCPAAQAAGVALYNATDRPVTVAVGHPGKPGTTFSLAAGEARLVPVGRQPDISFQNAGKAVKYRLEPYHAYMFSTDKNGVEFHGIDLAGAMPRPDDVPADPPALTPLRLPVALYADDANPRARVGWERLYRDRIAAASAVLEKQCGVGLTVASVGDWKSDASHGDLAQQAKLFETAATPPAGVLAVGFTSRFPRAEPRGGESEPPTGFARQPLWPYLLVRDGNLRTDSERTEALVREVGHFLGAGHTPDPRSAMRGKLADGRPFVGRSPIGLDPLNLLAVGIWADELRAGKPKSVADLKPASRERLAVIYKTLSGLLPGDELAAERLAELERVGEVAVPQPAQEPPAPVMPKAEVPKVAPPPAGVPPKSETPKADPPPAGVVPKVEVPKAAPPPAVVVPKPEAPKAAPPPVVKPSPEPPAKTDAPPAVSRAEAVRKVVQAVRLRAIDLKRDADADKAKGDALTVELLTTAGDIAYRLDGSVRVPAFLIGIGIALDDSDILRGNPLFAGLCKSAETDAERAERVAALGTPTLRGRRDLCQHFVVSAALAHVTGAGNAEALGLLKELTDRDGVSGFSFADLAADLAGIQLALAVAKFPEALGRFRDGVNLDEYMPAITGLREGLTAAKFKEVYGGTDDERFKAEVEKVRKRVTDMPKYKEIAEFKGK